MSCLKNGESKIFFRDQFREGRAAALRDAEGFQEILFTLERLGMCLTGKILDIGKYSDSIQVLAKRSPLALAEEVPEKWREWHLPFCTTYELVRKARNDALHQGAFARHLTDHVVHLALILEDALMSESTTVHDFMVREPVCAEIWQPISFVRQQMLKNSFSYLPILLEKDGQRNWHLLSDTNIVKYLKSRPEDERKKRLAKTVKEALKDEDGKLETENTQCCSPKTLVSEILDNFKGLPILITSKDHSDRLLGILTAFDLL